MDAGLVAVVVLAALGGCAARSTRMRGATTPEGRWEKVLALDATVFEHGRDDAVLPAPELHLRRGMSPCWDLGVRATLLGGALSARVQVVRHGGLAIAVAPGLGLEAVPVTNNGTDVLRLRASAAAIVDQRIGRTTSLVLSVVPALTIASPATIIAGEGGDAVRALFEPTVGLGLAFEVGRVVLWPEINATFPRELGGDDDGSDDGEAWERPQFQGGLAIAY